MAKQRRQDYRPRLLFREPSDTGLTSLERRTIARRVANRQTPVGVRLCRREHLEQTKARVTWSRIVYTLPYSLCHSSMRRKSRQSHHHGYASSFIARNLAPEGRTRYNLLGIAESTGHDSRCTQ